ncbi:fucose permease [Streptomyces sp. 1114.5]|uniref:MFS transporter n=1 Tax=Streptomyces sp. 1114.5 TaxID=1938830 RepID=UPI000EAE4EFC|nr:MFS transporter [Streptomyces sp. 1114.5]RKT18423.1 fucose permease [Streptomyces sp. 1114.5]
MARSAAVSAFGVFLVLGVLTASLGASLPFLRERFGAAHEVGRVVSAYNLGALAATVGIGLLGRRLNVRAAPPVLLGVFAAGAAGMAVSPGWAGYLGCAAVTGIGYGGLALTLNTAFARGFAGNSVVMVNRLNAVFGIGAMLGPLAAGAVGHTDIRLLALAAAVCALPCFLVGRAGAVLAVPEAEPSPEDAGQGGQRVRVGLELLPFLLVGLVYAGMETSIGTWQSTQLVRDGWTTQAATTAASGFWAGMAIGRLVVPQLTRRLPGRTTLPGYLAAALAALLLAAVPHLAVVAYPLAGLAMAPVLPTLIAWVSGVAEVPQQATSVLTLCCMLGNAVVPAVVGALGGSGGAVVIPLVLAGACLLCLGLAGWLRVARR